MQALEKGEVLPDDCIVLNISGAGIKRLKEDQDINVLEPWLRVKKSNAVDAILEKLSNG